MTGKGVSDLTQKIGLAAALAVAVSGGAAWASVSLFSFGDYVRERDEPRNDIWLRRHYYGTEPFFQFDESEGGFRQNDYVYLPRMRSRDLN